MVQFVICFQDLVGSWKSKVNLVRKVFRVKHALPLCVTFFSESYGEQPFVEMAVTADHHSRCRGCGNEVDVQVGTQNFFYFDMESASVATHPVAQKQSSGIYHERLDGDDGISSSRRTQAVDPLVPAIRVDEPCAERTSCLIRNSDEFFVCSPGEQIAVESSPQNSEGTMIDGLFPLVMHFNCGINVGLNLLQEAQQ